MILCYLVYLQIRLFHFRENFLQLDIFFKQLSYEDIQQQIAYDFFALICKSLFKLSQILKTILHFSWPSNLKEMSLHFQFFPAVH